MSLVDAIRLAAENGCEIVALGNGRVAIRSIAYDSDPCELDERRLLAMSRDEFVREWLPPRYES